jgi:hypothetical protein|tara:strand:- start:1615 stop:2181 length:567 start_codon:yes stop_codon:yes gene_type:complete
MTTDSKVTMQEMLQTIGSARDKLIANEAYSQRYAEEPIEVDEIIKSYGYTEVINPEWDSTRNSWKLQLPAIPIELPYSAGLRGVSVRGNDNLSMVRVEPNSNNMFRGLYGSSIPRDTYHREMNEIYFHQAMTEDMCIVMQIVPASKSLNSREEIPISQTMEIDIIKQVSEFYLSVGQVPEDSISDDND